MAVDSSKEQLQIRFITKDAQYAVPNTPFAVPSTVRCRELNTLLNEVIQEGEDSTKKKVEFEFLINGEFLRVSLKEHLESKEISSETVVDVEYIERLPAPEPQDCLLHDDWVSSVHSSPKWILTGCYDNSVQIWNVKGLHQLTASGHTGPVKSVSWVEMKDNEALFLSGSLDQTAMLWEWDISKNKVECISIYKGHERNIESLAVSPNSQFFASGGWDSMLKVWNIEQKDYVNSNENGESDAKRSKIDRAKIKTPKMTMKGHRDCISCVSWTSDSELLTSSWDHTLKLWDVEIGGIKKEIIGNKAFFHCDYSQINNTIITASADKLIRLYDPRSEEGSLIKNAFTSHTQWVQCVRWSKTEENLFISGGYDKLGKLWDRRSPKAPLFDLTGHEDKVLACDWSQPSLIVSGGTDNTVRIYKFKTIVKKIQKNQ